MAVWNRMAVLTALGMAGALLAGCGTYTGANNPNFVAEPDVTTCRDILVPPSSTPRNVCQTNAEWAEYESEQQRASREMMRGVNAGVITQPPMAGAQ